MFPAALVGLHCLLAAPRDQISAPAGTSDGAVQQAPMIRANTNRAPAGRMTDGVLTINLVARAGVWYPEADDGPGLLVYAFAEEGSAPSIPGPLLRVPAGTEIRATIRNAIAGATLVLRGMHRRPGSPHDTVQVAAGATREVRFVVGEPGTYYYRATTGEPSAGGRHEGADSQLSGALIVDPRGRSSPSADRVFVIGVWSEPPDTRGPEGRGARRALVINGKSWPYTERLTYSVGDSIRWRWINASDRPHPMHLHGFYFRVDGRGAVERDTTYDTEDRRLVVTERLQPGATMALAWSPDRPGNWVFHCHILFHISPALRLAAGSAPAAGGDSPAAPRHAMEEMAGLVLGLRVLPARGAPRGAAAASGARRLRLLAQSRPGVYGADPGLGFVLHDADVEPARDSVAIPGSPIVLARGQAAAITVVNRLSEPTAVHWHGIELESYYDGVAGLSGSGGRLAPMIQPGDSFTALMTPPRAGTFIYHTHIDDVRQMSLGLYGAIVVLEAGVTFDPATDHILLFSIGGLAEDAPWLLNGSASPEPLELRAGVRHRLRLVGIPPAGTLDVSLVDDSTLATWRPLAKDGADLPTPRVVAKPATQTVTVGETYDFEYSRTSAADLRLEVRDLTGALLMSVPVRVR